LTLLKWSMVERSARPVITPRSKASVDGADSVNGADSVQGAASANGAASVKGAASVNTANPVEGVASVNTANSAKGVASANGAASMSRATLKITANGETIHEKTYLAACDLAELMLKGE